MLDDVGTKVALDRMTLAPSWLIETSPGNHQAGYLLDAPMTDGVGADQLMNAIIVAGLCDPGANGPRVRLARLPVATNGKHTPPFMCRMVKWSPKLRYSPVELVKSLQLELGDERRPKRHSAFGKQHQLCDGDPVWIPRPDKNKVLTAMRDLGLYKGALGDGKHDITCPWVQEHTGAIDSGSAYFEPDDSSPIGGFKCLHGHCAERRVRDLLQFVGIEFSAARMKPTIRVMAGEIHRVVDAAERELAQSCTHYQRGGLIVTIVTDPDTLETRAQNIGVSALVHALAGIATWERFDRRTEDWCRIDPPARHVAVLVDSSTYAHLPVLIGLTRQPYLRPDGSLMMAKGYDLPTRLFGIFDSSEFSVPQNPTRDEATAALAVLKNLLVEFSFAGDGDLAAALAAMLTAAVRPSLPHAPMIHVHAHVAGSGKSYLCELITALATPKRGAPTTFPADDEECHKLLIAELLRGAAVIEFDNMSGNLVAHQSLCTALTAEYLSGRILGASKIATVNTRTLFLSSGNNVGPTQDIARRCMIIHLDPGCEMPAARAFSRPELVGDVLRQRGRYVSAALTIVRAWIVAGRPRIECKPLAGYVDWSDLCRHPLLWLGLADPAQSLFVTMDEDPDRETLGRLLFAWHGIFGKAEVMVRDVVGRASESSDQHVELSEVLRDVAEDRGVINRKRLGWWIKRHAGQIVNGYRFIRGTSKRSAETWRVESQSSVLSVLTAQEQLIVQSGGNVANDASS
jgi:hypothetical protein